MHHDFVLAHLYPFNTDCPSIFTCLLLYTFTLSGLYTDVYSALANLFPLRSVCSRSRTMSTWFAGGRKLCCSWPCWLLLLSLQLVNWILYWIFSLLWEMGHRAFQLLMWHLCRWLHMGWCLVWLFCVVSHYLFFDIFVAVDWLSFFATVRCWFHNDILIIEIVLFYMNVLVLVYDLVLQLN